MVHKLWMLLGVFATLVFFFPPTLSVAPCNCFGRKSLPVEMLLLPMHVASLSCHLQLPYHQQVMLAPWCWMLDRDLPRIFTCPENELDSLAVGWALSNSGDWREILIWVYFGSSSCALDCEEQEQLPRFLWRFISSSSVQQLQLAAVTGSLLQDVAGCLLQMRHSLWKEIHSMLLTVCLSFANKCWPD